MDEELEDRLGHLRGETDAVVLQTKHRRAAFQCDPQADVTALRRVLGGVVEEVDLNLLQARGIGVDPERLAVEVGREGQPARLEEAARRVGGLARRRAQIDRSPLELDLVLGDAARLQEVVEERGHLRGLPLEDAEKRVGCWRPPRGDLSRAVAVTMAPSGLRSSCDSIARN